MKLFSKYKFLLGLFIGTFFVSNFGCKKYPDGPLLSLRTKKYRLCAEWTVQYFSINGVDSTEYLKNKNCYGYYIFDDDKNNQGFTYNSYGNTGTDTSKYYSAVGAWKFTGHKNFLSINSHSAHMGKYFNVGAFVADEVLWEIRKLTEKELWLMTTFTDGREYFIKFTLQNRRQ